MLTMQHSRADRITRTGVVEPFTREPVSNARRLIDGFLAMVRGRLPQLAPSDVATTTPRSVVVGPTSGNAGRR